MTAGSEWAAVVVELVLGVIDIMVRVALVYFLIQFLRPMLAAARGDKMREFPSPRVLLRRVYCRHRHLAKVRSSLGRHYTACARCGVDVNKNKSQEFRR